MFLVLVEVGATVCHEHVEFLEAVLVEELVYAFAGGVFTAGMLFFDGFFAAAEAGFGTFVNEFLDFFL